MSLDWDNLEMPAGAFIRKMSPKGTTVVDEQSGEVCDITSGGELISELHNSKMLQPQVIMQSPGFEPGPRTWQARIITKLYYDCSDFMWGMGYNCF